MNLKSVINKERSIQFWSSVERPQGSFDGSATGGGVFVGDDACKSVVARREPTPTGVRVLKRGTRSRARHSAPINHGLPHCSPVNHPGPVGRAAGGRGAADGEAQREMKPIRLCHASASRSLPRERCAGLLARSSSIHSLRTTKSMWCCVVPGPKATPAAELRSSRKADGFFLHMANLFLMLA